MHERFSPSRLEAILDSAVDAIITIDTSGLILSINPATETMFGYTSGEVLGNNIKMLMPAPYQEEHDGYLKNYIAGGPPKIIGIGREVVGLRKNGSTFPMHLAVSEMKVDGTQAFTGIVRDISDLKEAENKLKLLNEELETRVLEATEELRQAQAQLVLQEKLATLGQVSGGIAHEIRNPLTAVKTSIYYLVNAKNRTEEKTLEHLDRIDRQVSLIDNVITALSDVAKLPEPKRKPISVVELLTSVLTTTGIPSDIEVLLELPHNLPRILVDEFQIPMVFKNLVRNARDAMEAGGTLTVAGASRDGRVAIAVVDTGIGIPADCIGKIMAPLYSTKAQGMGLGLAITRAIVEKNGGEISVDSEEGKGSTFTVLLEAANA